MNGQTHTQRKSAIESWKALPPSLAWVQKGIGVGLLSYGVMFVYGLLSSSSPYSHWPQELVTIVLLTCCFFYSKRNPTVATKATLLVVLLEFTASMFLEATLVSPAIIAYPLIVFLAGMMLGGRAACWMAGVSGVIIPFAVYLSGAWGWDFSRFSMEKEGYWLAILEISLFVFAYISRHAVSSFNRALEATEQARLRYSILFQCSPDALLALNEAGEILEYNERAAQLLLLAEGKNKQPMIKDVWKKAGGIGTLDTSVHLIGSFVPAEIFLVSGKRRMLEVITHVHEEFGFHCLLILRDVTERRELEERLGHAQKLELVGRLAGGVAHDFNNLLTVVAGNAIQLKTSTDPMARQLAEEILDVQQRCSGLTRQLLAFARKDIFKPTPVDLSAMVAGMRRLLERVLGEKHRIEFELKGSAPALADLAQLEQVLLNLVCNARDAMPRGGRIHISTRTLEKAEADKLGSELTAHRQVLLSVSDEGIGMSPEVKARLFEPFFTTKPREQGTGLGLASAQGIVSRCGGMIAVETVLDSGSVFRIFLPWSDATFSSAPVSATEVQVQQGVRSARILLVEDEPAVRLLAQRILSKAGYFVTDVGDAVEALRLLSTGLKVDLVCSDIMLPGMSGIELVLEIKRLYGEMPVMLMSGYYQVDNEAAVAALNGRKVLQKPFLPNVLLAAVDEALGLNSVVNA